MLITEPRVDEETRVGHGHGRGPEPHERRRQAAHLVGWFFAAYGALTLVWWALGKLLLRSDAIVTMDHSLSERLAAGRTPRLDDLTVFGSALGDTYVKIGATALFAIATVVAWRRWRDALMVIVPLVLEASAFITVTWLVNRPRPDVPRLEGSPVNSSFPSGHVAAATAYGALIVVVAWHTRRIWPRVVTTFLVALVVAIVGYSRLYRGMHHLTDVIAGILLGIVSVAVGWWILRRVGLDGAPESSPVTPATTDVDPFAGDERPALERVR